MEENVNKENLQNIIEEKNELINELHNIIKHLQMRYEKKMIEKDFEVSLFIIS